MNPDMAAVTKAIKMGTAQAIDSMDVTDILKQLVPKPELNQTQVTQMKKTRDELIAKMDKLLLPGVTINSGANGK